MKGAKSLDKYYEITKDNINFYKKNKYIKLKNVLTTEEIHKFSNIISKKVNELNKESIPLNQRDTYGKAFLQLMNLWTQDEEIKEFVFSKRLAKIASELMEVSGVRLYHDQALYKEAGGGITPWHADQYYWPLDTDQTVTVWIPLQETPLEMGPLEFSAGSHTIIEGRELMISDESEEILKKKLRVNDFPHIIESFDIGEVSFHSGWIFHRAGANTTNSTRKVMTIIYFKDGMSLKKPENQNQQNDWDTWCPGAKIGEKIESPLNPILYP